jgi:AcrR family transcriptional regulator
MKLEKSASSGEKRSRKPRSDGRRNRESIIQAAKVAFAENGPGASLDDIARKAGVGAGTLYRHFPSREALLVAVCHAEVEKLADAAEQFGRELPPLAALRAWLLLFIEYLAAKKIIAAALNGLVGGSQMFEESASKVHGAVAAIYGRAIQAGDIRPDVDPVDHLRALLGVTYFGTSENWRASATRLVDILIMGSRP